MKELYLIRHAKSSWDHAHLDDFDRSLDDRGLRDAPKMAEIFGEKWPAPDILLTSPAIRAYQTAQFFRRGWGLSWDRFLLNDSIYEASPEALREVIAEVSPGIRTLALVGHNPGLSLLINELTAQNFELKTACIARISSEGSSFEVGKCHLVETRSPRDF